jgi:uncharacterized protein (TIGR02246 family)
VGGPESADAWAGFVDALTSRGLEAARVAQDGRRAQDRRAGHSARSGCSMMRRSASGEVEMSRPETSSRREDEEAINKVIVDMTEGFNKHDAKAATRMYTPDADLVTVRGEKYKGAAEMRKGLATIFATRAKHATLKTLHTTVRFIRPDVAIAHVTNELSGLISPEGQHLPAHQELSIRVFVKKNGRWRISAFHNTMLRPFGTPTEPR